MFVEVHLLQSFAPSNLNRDDTGSPKDCTFGGVRRARISSQCLKRAMRTDPSFAAATSVPIAQRTRLIVGQLRDRLVKEHPETEVDPVLNEFLRVYGKGKLKLVEGGRTDVALYVSNSELADMVDLLSADWPTLTGVDSKAVAAAYNGILKELLRRYAVTTTAPDIALFGRMLAARAEFGLEAACQVAHAISTHRVQMEMDFFTAVDDLQPQDETGAGMMGVIAYDSACYYRYARIDWGQLVDNLGGDVELAKKTVDGFLQATLRAVPSGKQNSHAANNPPSLAFAVVRQDGMAWNLANAFEQPVRADGGGYVAPSLVALDRYWGDLCAAYGQDQLIATAALRCGAGDVELPHLAAATVTGEAAWRKQVLSALESGG